MKKLMAILATAVLGALTLAANTGCDADLTMGDGNVYWVDDIPVAPRDWTPVVDEVDRNRELFKYVDLPMRELSRSVIDDGAYIAYFKHSDFEGRPVQSPLPFTQYFHDADGHEWEYALEAEYSEGNLRIRLSTSDFFGFEPQATFYFRLAIMR